MIDCTTLLPRCTPPRVMTDAEAAWVAGIVDGEGSVVIMLKKSGERGATLRLSVNNTDLRMCERLRQVTGEGTVNPRKQVPGCKPTWAWTAYTAAAVRVMQAIRPYLVCKGEKVDVALEFATYRSSLPRGHGFGPGTRRAVDDRWDHYAVFQQRIQAC